MKPIKNYSKEKILSILFFTGILLSLLSSFVYSIYNTDYHHWGFILGTSLDYINGKNLFKEIYIQYGPGQPYLYYLLSYVVDINYVSIGFVTGLVYSVTIYILYRTLIKITSPFSTLYVCTTALLYHPYSFYPWPDYYSGLCLLISSSIIILHKNKLNFIYSILAGYLLVLACIFRSTYIVNISSAFVLFYIYQALNNQLKSSFINKITINYITGLVIYILYLYINDDLSTWYKQSLNSAHSSYGIGWKNLIYLMINIFSPSKFIDAIFTIMFISSIIYLILLLLNRKTERTLLNLKLEVFHSNLIFIIMLGLTGFIQCLKYYENFRLQTACIPLYLVLAINIDKILIINKLNQNHLKNFFLIFMIASLFLKLPLQFLGREGMLFPLVDYNSAIYATDAPFYKNTKAIKILKNKKLDDETLRYYNSLYEIICIDDKKIINLTADPMIPYLCDKPLNTLSIPFFDESLITNTNPNELRIINNKIYDINQLIISHDFLYDSNLIQIDTVSRPESYRWLKKGNVYIYKKL